jgi:2-polyprenyl-3-methyl-5-hydroxy-6-metoxy-1,4-benzoquinol methylase
MAEPTNRPPNRIEYGVERHCPCCAAPKLTPFLETAYVSCKLCGALVSTADAAGYEADYYYHLPGAERRERLRAAVEWRWYRRLARVALVSATSARQPTAIDFGCSKGFFVEAGLAHGLAIRGYDVSDVALASARARGLGASCTKRDMLVDDQASPIDAADFVFAWEVIEHFDDIAAFLAAVRRVLHPGGWLLGSTPNGQSSWISVLGSTWHGFAIPQYHRIYFNPTALTIALARHGFSDVTAITCVDWRSSQLIRNTATELTKKFLGTNDIRIRTLVALAASPLHKIAEIASGRVNGLSGDTLLFAARLHP